MKKTFRDFPSTYVLMLFILTHRFYSQFLLTTQFYSHITHKTTRIGVHYARFCTYFVGENDDFWLCFYSEKRCKWLIINTWARYGSRTRLTGLGSPCTTDVLISRRKILTPFTRKSHERDSNPRPTHYECVALPTEPSWLFARKQMQR